MESRDYKERFREEYRQLDNRIQKLEAALTAWNELGISPGHDSSLNLLEAQLGAMKTYRCILRQRAAVEAVEI